MRRVAISSVVLVAAALLAGSAVAGTGKNQRGSFETLSAGTGMGLDIDGVVKIRRTSERTFVKAHVRGLEPGTTYAVHLHNAACAAANPGGGHYKHDPAGPAQPPNELWLSSDLSVATRLRASRRIRAASHTAAEARTGLHVPRHPRS